MGLGTSASATTAPGVEILGHGVHRQDEILAPAAVAFVASLVRRFRGTRDALLAARAARQARLDAGELPRFPEETAAIRASDWRASAPPADLLDRRVEITGPVDRKMVIHALNSGARVYMADFEDSNAPTWRNNVAGQVNLKDAVRRTIEFESPDGRIHRLHPTTATLMVRPRGWHLDEPRMLVDGRPAPGALFDFGLFFFHNAKELLARGSGPYFYLPKLEGRLEARLWNDVFLHAQEALGLPRGSVRATVLIETILAAFEMDEVLYELRDHSAGLNCGRWDYIFSFIKKFRNRPEFLLPDRARVTMTTHFLQSYVRLLIQTCHRRGVHAMGGMAAQIPVKNDPAANEEAFAKVRADKEREAGEGHDGTWVAHPGLVPVAKEVFDRLLRGPNQIDRLRGDVRVTEGDLLAVPRGPITREGLLRNVEVGVRYLDAWLRGQGCVPIHNLMEDAATAEICRAQVWQWLRHDGGRLEDGRRITPAMVRAEIAAFSASMPGAARLFETLVLSGEFPEFLTLEALKQLQE